MYKGSVCKKCGKNIMWLRTPGKKWMPADEGLVPYQKSDTGKDFVVNDRGELVRCNLQFEGKQSGMARIPHWATCPHADEFRGRKGGYRAG